MCLGVPGKIVEILPEDAGGEGNPAGLRRGIVDFGGVRKEVCLSCVEEAVPGDYVIVHVGFALSRIDPEEAAETLRLIGEMEEAERSMGLAPPADPPLPPGAAGGTRETP